MLFYFSFRLLTSSPDDQASGILLDAAGLDALSSLAPRGTRSIAANGAFALAAAVGVVTGVHRGTTDGRANVHPTFFAGFSEVDEVVIFVADDADGSTAVGKDLPDFARGQAEGDVFAFGTEHLSAGSGGAAHLSAFAGLKLDVVDEGTFGDVLQIAAVADFDIGGFARDDLIADMEVLRLDDVGLLAISVEDEGDVGVAVGIILDGLDGRRDVVLPSAEIDDTIADFVAAADVTAGDLPLIVAATGVLLRGEQRFFRSRFGDVLERRVGHGPTGLGRRTIGSNCHFLFLLYWILYLYIRI